MLSLFLIFEELIEIAGYHAVVQLAHLVGTSAVEMLEMLVLGDDVDLPAVKGLDLVIDPVAGTNNTIFHKNLFSVCSFRVQQDFTPDGGNTFCAPVKKSSKKYTYI